MDAAIPESKFSEFNLDPALAETVETSAEEEIVEGILRLEDPNKVPPLFRVVSQFNRICTGRFRVEDTWAIRQHPYVWSLKAARAVAVTYDGEDLTALDLPRNDEIPVRSTPPFGGRGCIVAALDFGLDFAHPNFLNPDGTTRLVAFWHQGAIYDAAYPNPYGYGRVFSRDEINAALRTSDPYLALNYHPAISDTGGNGSHGTHTLDIAAGNGRVGNAGSGSKADLMFVHLSTPRLGLVGDLGDSVRMLEGLDFVDKTAGGRPWVVNLSVGRTAGSHDGTSLVEQGMHELMRRGPGRVIVQSAGNYRTANLAVQGWLRDGEYRDLPWIVSPTDTTDNEVDAWYSGKDRFVIALRPPQGTSFVEVKLGEVADIVHEGIVVGRLYHRRNDPNNRDNHAEVFLYAGAPSGVWTLRLIGEYVISGRFHAWIERDIARPGAQSRFDAKITSQSYTLGTIATSPLVITVGAYDANTAGTPVAPFSSWGPTRDERRDKPELLAPGVGVIAARSIPLRARQQEGLLVARSGTSMAAPHVAGTIAAMFEAAGRPVSIDEIRDCLKQTAHPVGGGEHEECWGRLDTAEAVSRIASSKEQSARATVSLPQTQTFEPPIFDAATDDFPMAAETQPGGMRLDEGESLMNSDSSYSFLDRAEFAVPASNRDRRASEIAFLQQLMREFGVSVFARDVTPVALFRAAVNDSPMMQSARGFLKVVALPLKKPDAVLQAGDWMLRVVPGTGDVGHVSVLASDDLLSQSVLVSEDIAAESAQPGFYGLVIEGGAFPHTRSEPFARRVLDSRGRVPPHTVILRPELQAADAADEFERPAWLKIEHRSRGKSATSVIDSVETESVDSSDDFSAPAWLKVEHRSRDLPEQAEFEDTEGFTFEPTGAQTDFGPKLRKAWHAMLDAAFNMNVDEATGMIEVGLGITAGAKKHVRFFNPAAHSPTIKFTQVNVPWRAFPIGFGSPSPATFKLVDEPMSQFDRSVGFTRMLRGQDEYCEWQVFRDSAKKIVRVVFTSEPPEYYDFLYDPGVPSLKKFSRDLLVKLYQERCGTKPIPLADLEITVGGVKRYDRGNKWNNDFCVHLQQPQNTLLAQINIAARASVVRSDASGTLITNAKALNVCNSFGEDTRQSDPAIGDNVNKLARDNQFLTLQNPVGLYMMELDTTGWKTPDKTDAQTFWKVLKGKTSTDKGKNMILRAEFAVPASKKYTVSDIEIGGVPIEFGSQIAEHVKMRLGASVGPKDKDLKGGKLAAPTPVIC
jgi:subtilisin family serine protease